MPIDLAQAQGDGITIAAYRNLFRHLGLPDRPIQVKAKVGQTANPDEDVLRQFKIDFRYVGLGAPDDEGDADRRNSYQEEWGVVRTKPARWLLLDLTAPRWPEMPPSRPSTPLVAGPI